MNIKLAKELSFLANILDKKRLIQEADIIDSILKKIAEPDDDWSILSGPTNPGVSLDELSGDSSELNHSDISFRKTRDLPRWVDKDGESKELTILDNENSDSEMINYIEMVDRIGSGDDVDYASNIKRISISNKKIESLMTSQSEVGPKPRGLWYACDNDWLQWLIYEMPHWIGNYVYSFDINMSNVLQLSSLSDLKNFQSKYGSRGYIDWREVAMDFSGIEICPYIYEGRYDIPWYYGWDVASGCIWDSSAFNSLKIIAEKVNENPKSGRGTPEASDPKNWAWYGF